MKEGVSLAVLVFLVLCLVIFSYYTNGFLTGGVVRGETTKKAIAPQKEVKTAIFCNDNKAQVNSGICRRSFVMSGYIGSKCTAGKKPIMSYGNTCYGAGLCRDTRIRSSKCQCQYICI